MGGWVGWMEENEAVGMSYCELGLGKWVDGVGGWVGFIPSFCSICRKEPRGQYSRRMWRQLLPHWWVPR